MTDVVNNLFSPSFWILLWAWIQTLLLTFFAVEAPSPSPSIYTPPPYETKYLEKIRTKKEEQGENGEKDDAFYKGLIASYVMECTPIGNVAMRYNHDRGSFEYFSDHNIPYRFLEPVGRKYVMTFDCLELYVDMEEELARAKRDLELKEDEKRQEQEKQDASKAPETKKGPFAQFKSYNNQAPLASAGIKNRASTNMTITKQPTENNNEPVLLKEKANRYTQIGRFSNFDVLKKVEKKLVDKRLEISFAEFKRMQKEAQTKRSVPSLEESSLPKEREAGPEKSESSQESRLGQERESNSTASTLVEDDDDGAVVVNAPTPRLTSNNDS